MEHTAMVVSAHRAYPTLEKCLRGLLSAARMPRDVIFVDNGSPEHLADLVARRLPDLSTVRLEENRQFCGGYNAGLKLALDREYDFVLLVNADTEVVNPHFVGALADAARRFPRAAFVGPLVYYRTRDQVQTTCLRFPAILRNALVWLPWRFMPGLIDRQPDAEKEVDLLNGVCVLCRARALRDIGLMDELYGGYQEDTDWAWRAKQKGWSSIFSPVPSIIHHEEARGYESFSLKSFLLKRNTVFWFLKVGKHSSAILYACASMALAHARTLLAGEEAERRMHRYFVRRLGRSYQGLLLGEELGAWFGPPLGPWDWSNPNA